MPDLPWIYNIKLDQYNMSVRTCSGEVRVISRNDCVPCGWRILTFNEGAQIKNQLHPLLGQWSIVGFDHGKLDGAGYGYQLSNGSGPECGEQFIIR